MLTKTMKKKSATTVVRFYMAEDFREEKDGKVSAICLYTDLNVLLQMPADLPDPTPDSPAVLRSMCFLFSISEASARASISIDLKNPIGTQNVVASQPLPDQNGTANFIIRMDPCLVTVLGTRTFTVNVDQQKFVFDFQFGRQNIPIPSVGTNSSPAKASPKGRAKNKDESK